MGRPLETHTYNSRRPTETPVNNGETLGDPYVQPTETPVNNGETLGDPNMRPPVNNGETHGDPFTQ